jgi:hypothetical protein
LRASSRALVRASLRSARIISRRVVTVVCSAPVVATARRCRGRHIRARRSGRWSRRCGGLRRCSGSRPKRGHQSWGTTVSWIHACTLRGSNARMWLRPLIFVVTLSCQAAIWYSCVRPPRTCFRRT